jgi:hypothetical protein
MKIALYQIGQEYMMLADEIIANEGELSPELENRLMINQDQLEAKGKGYGYIIKDIEAEIDAIDMEIKRLSAMKKSRSNAVDKLKTSLSDAMQLFDITELKTPTLKINFRKSESVEIENVALLDKDFIKVVTTETADKIAIKEAIKNGVEVTGAVLKQNYNLQIK